MIAEKFKTSSSSPTHSVNYVWLCAQSPLRTFPDYATRLPLHNFEKLYENAKRYPSAEFNLWFDFRQLTIRDQFFLNTHRYSFEANHIHIRDLNDIQIYKDSPGFELDTNIALYARADCARVLVLDHLLKTRTATTVIYSDVDCDDVMVGDNNVTETLEKYGLSYGRSGGHPICNGYIALHGDKGADFMSAHLLPRTIAAFQKNRVNHFGAFSDAVRKYRDLNFPEIRCPQLGLVELPLMRTPMPYNPAIYGRVSPETPTRVPSSLDFV